MTLKEEQDAPDAPEQSIEELISQLADEKKQKDKIASDYKSVEAERNSYRDSLVKTRGAIESNGLGKFTDNWDLSLDFAGRQTTKESTNPIDDKISSLSKRYDDGEIETKDYVNELAELKARKIFDQEYSKREAKTAETINNQSLAGKNERILTMLDKNIPDHNNTNSELFKEMTRIVNENQDVYGGVDLTRMENIKIKCRKILCLVQ